MPINVPNKGLLDSRIGSVSTNLRDAMRAASDLFNELSTVGADQLVAIGYTTEDVNNLLATFGAIGQLANAYEGGQYAGPALPFDFLNSTAGWWG